MKTYKIKPLNWKRGVETETLVEHCAAGVDGSYVIRYRFDKETSETTYIWVFIRHGGGSSTRDTKSFATAKKEAAAHHAEELLQFIKPTT